MAKSLVFFQKRHLHASFFKKRIVFREILSVFLVFSCRKVEFCLIIYFSVFYLNTIYLKQMYLYVKIKKRLRASKVVKYFLLIFWEKLFTTSFYYVTIGWFLGKTAFSPHFMNSSRRFLS